MNLHKICTAASSINSSNSDQNNPIDQTINTHTHTLLHIHDEILQKILMPRHKSLPAGCKM